MTKFRTADVLYRQGRHADALAMLDDLDRRFPNTKNLMYARALCLAGLGRRVEAMDLCDALIVQFGAAKAVKLRATLQAVNGPEKPADSFEEIDPLLIISPPVESHSRPPRRSFARLMMAVFVPLAIGAAGWFLWRNAHGSGDALPPPVVVAGPPPAPAPPAIPAAPPLSDQAQAYLDSAKGKLQFGRFTEAADLVGKALETAPDHPTAMQVMQWVRDDQRQFLQQHGKFGGDTRVTCLDNPGQSYELYVPSTALPEKSAILYVFSPAGDGKGMMQWMVPAADRLSWIIAASNNSRNGPWEPILEAQDAVLRDTEARLDLHPTRRFATGFSGGARASLAMAFRHAGKVTGVLAMGAGWPINTNLMPSSQALSVCMLIGDQDGNIQHDIPTTEQRLQAAGVPFTTAIYAGAHVQPPPELILQACDWLNSQSLY